MKNSKNTASLILVLLCIAAAGCSSKPDKDAIDMGPAPTGPPSGSRFATAQPGFSPEAFVAKLQGMPSADRAALMRDNQTLMTQIMAGPDTPAKKKLATIINQH